MLPPVRAADNFIALEGVLLLPFLRDEGNARYLGPRCPLLPSLVLVVPTKRLDPLFPFLQQKHNRTCFLYSFFLELSFPMPQMVLSDYLRFFSFNPHGTTRNSYRKSLMRDRDRHYFLVFF